MIKLNFLLYFTLFSSFYLYNVESKLLEQQLKPSLSQADTIRKISESLAIIELNEIVCASLEKRDTKCETCQCDVKGRNFNCVTKLDTPCHDWKIYAKLGLATPGTKNFRCTRGELMPNNIESCFMCSCAENEKQVQCTYGQDTVCVPPQMKTNAKITDPHDWRPWNA